MHGSGNTQDLLEVVLDCDRDSVLFVVKQSGGFCHRPHLRSCFGDDVGLSKYAHNTPLPSASLHVSLSTVETVSSGCPRWFFLTPLLSSRLLATVAERRIQAPPGSYTKVGIIF
jgi:hypothetical protein